MIEGSFESVSLMLTNLNKPIQRQQQFHDELNKLNIFYEKHKFTIENSNKPMQKTPRIFKIAEIHKSRKYFIII